jgi:hypothetical protein
VVRRAWTFPLIAFGEERVASSLAAIIIAAVPLIGAVLAFRFDPSERPTSTRSSTRWHGGTSGSSRLSRISSRKLVPGP